MESTIARVVTEDSGYTRLTLDCGAWTLIDATLTTAQLQALHAAILTHAMTAAPVGSEFYERRVIASDAYRPGDDFPEVGYVRRLHSLLRGA